MNSDSPQIDWLQRDRLPVAPGFPQRLVILDCETTGGKPTFHRIIELGLVIVEDGRIVQRWQSLVDPETPLPVAIRQLTGIDEEMLAGAPTFARIAETLLQHLEGRILVAHNARFDHAFLKNEFARIGVSFRAKPLCSVKLSRRLFPGQRGHGLDAIVRRFGLAVRDRHRALDDALAVWQFFLRIGESIAPEQIGTACDKLLARPALPPNLDPGEIERLPCSPGVYYFYDAADRLLYVGKSVKLRDRVMSHFNQDYRNPKDLRISASIAHIDFETTASDLGAQLLESRQIKALAPLHNRRLRRLVRLYEYQLEPDREGYLRVRIAAVERPDPGSDLAQQFGLFRSRRQALQRLEKLSRDFLLCQKLTGLQTDRSSAARSPCFAHQLKRCLGACCGKEPAQRYNERLNSALADYRTKTWPWPDALLIEERGSPPVEPVWHLAHEWRYLGAIQTPDELYDLGYAPIRGDTPTIVEQQPDKPDAPFDLDTYLILTRFLLQPRLLNANGIRLHPLTRIEAAE